MVLYVDLWLALFIGSEWSDGTDVSMVNVCRPHAQIAGLPRGVVSSVVGEDRKRRM